ncbi:MAG: prepilin-type N-terminal cleavage/methylation domain-containing protein [Fibrobacterota bacterium]|nr:prepilin-type N-terminal cleavage/methylation domain-containing protein [Fibrobacterota bacterium]QQS05405.1 MAG: prepilin-type N-terminal cleavage/methylation domain-containing protein [Fibrobacterota bacterium]
MTCGRNRGVTLVELLVAMALAGIVAVMVFGWMGHASKVSHASQVRDDRDQDLAILRDALFQDGTFGQVLSVAREEIVFVRGRDTLRDTLHWTVGDTGLSRSGRRFLTSDTVDSWEITPRMVDVEADMDPWSLLDKDLDGKVDPESMGKVDAVEIRLVVRHRGFPALDQTVTDTLRLIAPVRGPG